MNTLPHNLTPLPALHTQAVAVSFGENAVHIRLNTGQTIVLDLNLPWLRWLSNASPEQRNHWSIEPHGVAVYWEDLDDGIEVCHALEAQSIYSAISP